MAVTLLQPRSARSQLSPGGDVFTALLHLPANGNAVSAGDFDGDGRLDLAFAVPGANYVSVFLNRGASGFVSAPGSPFAVGYNPWSIAVGDFNGDHKPDMAICNDGSGDSPANPNSITVLLGTGNGGFTAAPGSPIPFGANDGPVSVVTADLNHDGNLDLVTANVHSYSVTVLLGSGNGTFVRTAASPIPVQSDVFSVALADLDGDGKLDLVLGTFSGNGSPVMLGDGSGGFTPTASRAPTGLWPWSVAAGDFNGDGKTDLAATNWNDFTVTVLLGAGNGTFQPASGSPYPVGRYPSSVAVADFNNDGKADLAVSAFNDSNVTVLRGNGLGGFTPGATRFNVTSFPNRMITGDFNSDGVADVVVSSGDILFRATPTTTNLTLSKSAILSGVPVTLTATVSNSFGAAVPAGSVSFYDGAARLTTVAVNSGGTASFATTFGMGNHSITAVFTPPNTLTLPSTSIASVLAVDPSSPPAAPALYSPSNGALNLGTTVTLSWSVTADATSYDVYIGTSSRPAYAGNTGATAYNPSLTSYGGLAPGSTYYWRVVARNSAGSTSSETWSFTTQSLWQSTDFNLDGRSDIIWQDPLTGLAQIWLLGGVQGTSVNGSVNLTASNTWRIVGVGDFNQDGRLDVVWQDPGSGAAQVWFLGGAQGNVVNGAAVLAYGNSWRIASVADFNGDGRPDCIWQDPATGLAQIWFLGGIQGTSVSGAVNLTASNSWRIAGTGDFNADGRPDVVWQDANTGAAQVWYLGGAQGNVIAGAAVLSYGSGWRIAAINDFNGDGRVDVIWQDPASGASQAWFLGDSNGVTVTGAAAVSGANSWRILGPR